MPQIYQGGYVPWVPYIPRRICSLGALYTSYVYVLWYHIISYLLLFTGTATQLYFTWRGNRYEPGDSILITDIRLHDGNRSTGDSLVCVTTDVNTQCCTDVGGVGEWFFPNGTMVPRNNNTVSQIVRTGQTNQIRLNFRTRQKSPTGEYTCVVPETGSSVNQTAGIRLVTGTYTVCKNKPVSI